ncbi:MAG: MFS transporter [Spirochaetales bacterium]|nr:MFS transporter [Spirochaetales bacterium]
MQQGKRSIKIGYGAAEAGVAAVELMIQLYVLKFYISYARLDPALAGIALALAVVWDALTDPLMGAISDRASFRAGRRRPFIMAGAVLLAFVFPLLFLPPVDAGQLLKFCYLLGSFILVNTSLTVLSIPHAALGGEISPDPSERTALYASRLFSGNIGLLAGTLIPGALLAAGYDGAYLGAAALISVLVLASAAISFFITRGFDSGSFYGSTPAQNSRLGEASGHAGAATGEEKKAGFATLLKLVSPQELLRQWSSVLSNRIFIPVLLAFFIATFGRTLNSSIALYYYEYYLDLTEEVVVLNILVPFVISISISIPVWVIISRRFGKKIPAFISVSLLGAVGSIVYPFFPTGDLTGPVMMALGGGFLVASVVLLDAIVADILDYDQLKTGLRREGLYFGFWRMSAKIARALSLAMSGFVLAGIGFEPALTEQPDEVSFRLALLFGPGVGLLFIAGALIFLLTPWNPARHAQVRGLLVRRHSRPLAPGP